MIKPLNNFRKGLRRAHAIAVAKEEKRADQVLDSTAGKGQELQSFDRQVEAYSMYLTFVKVYARLADGLIPIAVSTTYHGLRLITSLTQGARACCFRWHCANYRVGLSTALRCVPIFGPSLCVLLSLLIYIFIPWRVGLPFRMWCGLVWGLVETWAVRFVWAVPA